MVANNIFIYPAIAALLFLNACNNKKTEPPKSPPPVAVTLDTVKTTDAVYYEEYPAIVSPLDQINFRPQVSGFITGVYFKDGERVKKGQLLYSIDDQLYSANYQQAVANLNVQKANLIRTQKDADRYHELEKNDAVAKQLVDNADAALEVAKKQADAASAAIRAVETNVKYTKIYAPFDGLIGISAVKTGSPVTAGQTVLDSMSTDNVMAVDFNPDQKQIFRFVKMMNEKQDIADSLFRLSFGDELYPQPGKLSFLDRAVNPQTGTIKARLIFPNDKKLLIAGMNATVKVKSSKTGALIIPFKAVTEQLGEFFVYVPGDSNKVSQRKIGTGRQIGTNVIVTDGLKEGEIVVVQGTQNLKEGTVITTKAPGQQGTKPKIENKE